MSDERFDDLSPSELVQRAARIDQFLKDDAIATAFGKLERRYYEDFKCAETDEERRMAQAKAIARDALLNELKVFIKEGEHEVLVAAEQAKRQARAPHHPEL